MLCEFEKLLFPTNPRDLGTSSFMVAVYKPCEKILDNEGISIQQIKVVGFCLPISQHLRFDLKGHWNKNTKHGIQFEMDTYEEVVMPTRECIVAYLSSGQIIGIGMKIANRIFDKYGIHSLEILDREPERLLEISGITKDKLNKICDSYLANRAAREVVAFLTPHGITANRAVELFKVYGNRTMEIVKEHPYRLCEVAGVGFLTADKIAMNMGHSRLSPERTDEGLLYTLADAESKGHLCMSKQTFLKAGLKILETPELTEDMIANRAARLVDEKRLATYHGKVYLHKTAESEKHLAELINSRLSSGRIKEYLELDEELDREELGLKIKLAPEQREAVKTALTQSLTIITGGPGTGKTALQKAILNIYRRNNPDKIICCCAPTGRAARRMEQSTGIEACTVHKALSLFAGEDGLFSGPKKLEADLILVDETSMLDQQLAEFLFIAADWNSQIIFVGDADQLPSVGPGAVLSEMIASKKIPVVRLDKVYRQQDGSRIAINAKLIRHGNLNLEYGNDFMFFDSPSPFESAELLVNLYMKEVAKYGVDNVALLSPFRQKTETGVNALNILLQNAINPYDINKPEVSVGKKKYRLGDKVMQNKNIENISNGDIGYIKEISHFDKEFSMLVDFGDGRIQKYETDNLGMLELAYASTIHKSQGAEFTTVIINMQYAHWIMLTRPLLYTAITRGKKNVIIVGERRAVCLAISKTDADKRGTCLSERLIELEKIKEN